VDARKSLLSADVSVAPGTETPSNCPKIKLAFTLKSIILVDM
jgi:hypothetical protein